MKTSDHVTKDKSQATKQTFQSGNNDCATITDNRPAAIFQRKLRQTMNDQLTTAPAIGKRNNGLPLQLKSGIENLSGYSMDDVKVHYNSAKPAQLNALAYAQGTDIHLGPGQQKHLPHEAWHVAQQKQGRVKPARQFFGKSVNDDIGLEREADVMGEKAASFTSFKSEIGLKQTLVNNPVTQRRRVFVGVSDPDLDKEEKDEIKNSHFFHRLKYLCCFLKMKGKKLSKNKEKEVERQLFKLVTNDEQELPTDFFTTQNLDAEAAEISKNEAFTFEQVEREVVAKPKKQNFRKRFAKGVIAGLKKLKRIAQKKKYRYDITSMPLEIDEQYIEEPEYNFNFPVTSTNQFDQLVVADDLTIALNNPETEVAKEFYATDEVFANTLTTNFLRFEKSTAHQMILQIGNVKKKLFKITPRPLTDTPDRELISLGVHRCVEVASKLMGMRYENSLQQNIQTADGRRIAMTLGEQSGDIPLLKDLLSETSQNNRDERLGINRHAFPDVGQAYATFSLSFTKDSTYGYHFGTVVAKSEDGQDNLTLENFNRSEIRNKMAEKLIAHIDQAGTDFTFNPVKSAQDNYRDLVVHLYQVNHETAGAMWRKNMEAIHLDKMWYFNLYGWDNHTWDENWEKYYRTASQPDSAVTLVMANPDNQLP